MKQKFYVSLAFTVLFFVMLLVNLRFHSWWGAGCAIVFLAMYIINDVRFFPEFKVEKELLEEEQNGKYLSTDFLRFEQYYGKLTNAQQESLLSHKDGHLVKWRGTVTDVSFGHYSNNSKYCYVSVKVESMRFFIAYLDESFINFSAMLINKGDKITIEGELEFPCKICWTVKNAKPVGCRA